MEINNILIVSPMYKKLKVHIEKAQLSKSFRYLPEDMLTKADLEWADALVCFNLKTNVDYSRVKWVHSLGAGVDRFLYKKKWNENVLLTRTICSFGQRIAEYCLSYLLKDLQFHQQFEEFQQQKTWQPLTPKLLSEQKIMIYGTGEIGSEIAKMLTTFGVEVYGVSLSGTGKEHFHEVLTLGSHESLLSKMDYLINTLPLTEKTAYLFDKELFKHLSHAGFINVGRGAAVNEEDLLKAIIFEHVRFAVLDVFAQEPLPVNHPFWDHPKVLLTPHISAVTTPEEGVECFIETLKRIEEGTSLVNKVDVKKGY
jgi:glyoxylate/hydroxypyruvate reductase